MAQYIVTVLGNQAVCPKCSGSLVKYPHDILYQMFDCYDCHTRYYCIREGYTEREYIVSDNLSEALMEFADEP